MSEPADKRPVGVQQIGDDDMIRPRFAEPAPQGFADESDETAYAELVEFVRVGVQLLYEELAAVRHAPLPAAAPLH